MKETKNKRRPAQTPPKCPYCGSTTVLRRSGEIYASKYDETMLYVCRNYPSCDSYVRVHQGTTIPVGTPANRELRALRKEAHHYFDQLYTRGYMTKDDAYRWLADLLCVPVGQAHIGYLGEYYCKEVISKCKELLARYTRPRRGWYLNRRKRKGVQHETDRETARIG